MAKTSAITIRITEGLKAVIAKAAEDDDRSITSWIERTIKSTLKKSGYLK